jgi:uncharacterized protein YuzE
MKITYDKAVDAMYIKSKKGKYDHTKKVSEDILVDISKKGEVLGVEILDAKENVGSINPEKLNVEVATI